MELKYQSIMKGKEWWDWYFTQKTEVQNKLNYVAMLRFRTWEDSPVNALMKGGIRQYIKEGWRVRRIKKIEHRMYQALTNWRYGRARFYYIAMKGLSKLLRI